MKKLVSILLLMLYLVSTTELYQLLKIPQLVEHYIEHKGLNAEMSLTTFLKIHYDNPVKDGDFGKDQKLPFIIHAKPLNLIFTLDKGFELELQNNSFKNIVSHRMPSKDEGHCFKGFVDVVWEPPRFSFS
ncbi:hypothetical protein [Chryseobacterium sp.]|uniref:hypothetical protein n=1 Tax=Chryseobacterium sp. TaxID=1871047 RepID=UPI00289E9765|nr:hypothetical protein [Chryseobacterium sp.]